MAIATKMLFEVAAVGISGAVLVEMTFEPVVISESVPVALGMLVTNGCEVCWPVVLRLVMTV